MGVRRRQPSRGHFIWNRHASPSEDPSTVLQTSLELWVGVGTQRCGRGVTSHVREPSLDVRRFVTPYDYTRRHTFNARFSVPSSNGLQSLYRTRYQPVQFTIHERMGV